jgi:hypothetical protein
MTNTHGADRARRRIEWLGRTFALGMMVLMPALMRPRSAPAGTDPAPGATFSRITTGDIVTTEAWYWNGSWGDYDDDGWLDLFVGSTFPSETNSLYHNNRDGTFALIDAASMPKIPSNQHGAAWADYDNDGLLDLFVARYIDFDLASAPLPGARVPGVNCMYRGLPVMCGPRGLKGAPDVLYHNNGDGTFTDVTEWAGIDRTSSRGLGAVWGDYNNDGRPDLLVANDAQPNQLYRNRGDGTFEEVALTAGVAVDEDGRERAGMGVDFGDYDNDGWLDVAIGNFYGEPSALYRNQHDGSFEETTWSSGIGPPTVPVLTWGTRFFDHDNDGWKDLLFVNGHVYPEVDAHRLDETYAQRALLLRNNGNGTYTNAGAAAGEVWGTRWAGRGAAIGDYDNDGRLDIAIAVVNGPPVLLQNRGGEAAHWISAKLVGSQSNRDGVGARVTVLVNGRSLMEEVHGGGSYLSQSDTRVHFGLGGQSRVEAMDIAWPSGRRERVGPLDADTIVTIKEGSGVVSTRRRR